MTDQLILRQGTYALVFASLVIFSLNAADRPNIVFVFSDDHATQAISSYGGILAEVAPTPHLDRLAAQGMRFDRCLVTNSICGPSLVGIMKGKRPRNWRKTHYYHYYEYPGWHMVQRHEGVYDGRYKLMNFYDVEEWELYDLTTDPNEMKNQYQNPEYAKIVARLHKELDRSRKRYDLPEIERQSLENLDMRYHSSEILKRLTEGGSL